MKPNKLLLTSLLPLLLAASPATTSAPAPLTATTGTETKLPPQVTAKLTPLFDGKSLANWTIQDKATTTSPSWTVTQTTDGPVLASTGAGRGTLYTSTDYGSYRILFDIRHLSGKPDHQPCVLVFCTRPPKNEKPADALAGVQFQVPSGGHWDYRKGFNVGNNINFKNLLKPKFNNNQWARVEILVDNNTGSARMAVASPIGTHAIEILDFNDPALIHHSGPFALQMHNANLFDQYKNIQVEPNPTINDLLTTK